MTTRRLALLSIGFATLASLSVPAMAGDWGFGFSFGYSGRYYRPCYFPRAYVYRDYCAPAVVYSDYYPEVVTYDVAPTVTYFRGYCGPRVVYRDCGPRYFVRGTYAARSYYPAYRPSYFSFRYGGHGPAPHGRPFHH